MGIELRHRRRSSTQSSRCAYGAARGLIFPAVAIALLPHPRRQRRPSMSHDPNDGDRKTGLVAWWYKVPGGQDTAC
ncbi:hypothetical protein DMH04_18480 [Kibdelosporangium aridum]|uniref:Uncharacterized protein n=1 Tax=Kibdelosporangium aridum TaxID=2030 RepID=A0A428ZB36_KIBAR|nr:hypothetical protein DMH04_18480 [Kibdelosporangium aridum]